MKPFAFDELLARLRAVSRRTHQGDTLLEVGDLRLDTAAMTTERSGVSIDLTPREFALPAVFVASYTPVLLLVVAFNAATRESTLRSMHLRRWRNSGR